jgi:hypothetical protein
MARLKVIVNDGLMALAKEFLAYMTSDISRASGDQNGGHFLSNGMVDRHFIKDSVLYCQRDKILDPY